GPNVIFEDADLDAAVQGSLFAAYHNQGQACIAGSRLLVHESIWDAFVKRFTERVRSIRIGDPLEETTQLGPLTSKDHQKKVLGYVDVAKGEGAQILFGGRVPGTPETARGYYMQPTLVRADNPKMRVCQEEVFGPFITITPVTDDSRAEECGNGRRGLGRLFHHGEMAAFLDCNEPPLRDPPRRRLPDLPIELRILSAPDDEGRGAHSFEIARDGRVGASQRVA